MSAANNDDEFENPPEGGLCQGQPVSWFYPDPRTRGITKDMRNALNMCSDCIVRWPCAEYALRHEVYGIWGGLTEKDRVQIRARRKIVVKVPGFSEPILFGNNK